MQADHTGVMPALFDASEGQLHRTHVWQEEHVIFRERLQEQVSNAIEQRIARSQHHSFLLPIAAFELLEHPWEVCLDEQFLALPVREKRQMSLAASQDTGPGNMLQRCRGQPTRTIVPNANHDERLTGHAGNPCCAMSSSALTVAVATALPPFRPRTVITGLSRVSACSLLSTTETKPTGIATISPGCTRPWRTHVHSVSS